MFIESGYYDSTYFYYYANGVTYKEYHAAPMNPLVAVIIVGVVCIIICAVAFNSRNHMVDDDGYNEYSETVVTETVVEGD